MALDIKSLTPEDIAKAPLVARITSAAILQDKSQVIRGNPTGINVIALLDVVDAIKQSKANPRTISASFDELSPMRADKRNDAENNE